MGKERYLGANCKGLSVWSLDGSGQIEREGKKWNTGNDVRILGEQRRNSGLREKDREPTVWFVNCELWIVMLRLPLILLEKGAKIQYS